MPLIMSHRTITDADIAYAENILLPEGEKFDSERVTFIKELGSVDLQACPGSGKTTCLMAKLLILARELPFDDGSGILVLSHTNGAVDEIKEKIAKYYPQLFKFPTFIGTIQSFVDHFLAIPYYVQKYKHKPLRIDSQIFYEQVWEPGKAKFWLTNNFKEASDRREFLGNICFDLNDNLVSGPVGTPENFRIKDKNCETYKALYEMKNKLLESGYISYDDAYYFAACYIKKFPKIVDLLQKRFKYVFIDEMQDTDTHQLELIDTVFPMGGGSSVQRIGDQNQAIYSKVKPDVVWKPRDGYFTLNGSKRLSPSIAATIKNISLTPQDLVGNPKRQSIKPKILLFDDSSIQKVPNKFCQIVIDNSLHKRQSPIFKAIGWRKRPTVANGLTIGSYFTDSQTIKQRMKIDYDSLKEYLFFERTENISELNSSRKNIINALIKILRIAKIKNVTGADFTGQSFLKFLSEKSPEEYEKLQLNLLNWCMSLVKGLDIHTLVSDYASHLLNDLFGVTEIADEVNNFITYTDNDQESNVEKIAQKIPINRFHYITDEGNIDLEIATIHSIKGETHTGTLYLETYYYNDGGRSYESERLIEQLKGNRATGKIGKRVQESLKMAYVGMSRPTDLLCIAIHKTHIPTTEMPNLNNMWDVVEV